MVRADFNVGAGGMYMYTSPNQSSRLTAVHSAFLNYLQVLESCGYNNYSEKDPAAPELPAHRAVINANGEFERYLESLRS